MEVALVFPHQLFRPHPAVSAGRKVFLIEDPLFFGTDLHWPLAVHAQKSALHFASMEAYAEELRDRVPSLEWIRLPEHPATTVELLESAMAEEVSVLHVADPVDDVLDRRLRRFAERRGIRLEVYPSPNFLTPADFLERHTGMQAKPFMARFYQAQRKRMDLMVGEDGAPLGGAWSFDAENRQRWPKDRQPPEEPRAGSNRWIEQAMERVRLRFPEAPGELDGFRWPVTRKDARRWFKEFLRDRFAGFGPYEDAITRDHGFLHHSAITPSLNIGLLDPTEVVRLAMDEAGQVPIESLEGFVRQVIGWREFMAGIYRHRSAGLRTSNFWRFDRPMPKAFYDATTGIPPVDHVIRQVLREGYCHHIERLMILGNFMLLCRIRPDDVYRWFMELFVDAYDWVMVPNVYGMSQFADGGTFTTKPYLSGSNYILKMSDEPKGEWCAVWDALFWTFIGDHLGFFVGNHRLSMMARGWERMGAAKQEQHRGLAGDFLGSIS